jgi:hypothetical protein
MEQLDGRKFGFDMIEITIISYFLPNNLLSSKLSDPFSTSSASSEDLRFLFKQQLLLPLVSKIVFR